MFPRLQSEFEDLAADSSHDASDATDGSSVSVHLDGIECLTLFQGSTGRESDDATPWTRDTLAPIYSATKGPAAATLLAVLEEADLHPDDPVGRVWPKLGRGAAAQATFADVLAHRAGLPALDPNPSVWDFDAVIAALEAQEPAWKPGDAHGYHPRTFGFVLDHLVRLITGGLSLGSCWDTHFRQPLGLDLWIGLPESEHHRVARLQPARITTTTTSDDSDARFRRERGRPDSLVARAFRSPAGLNSVSGMNSARVWSAGFPAFGGVASAAGLARFYSLLAAWIAEDIPRANPVEPPALPRPLSAGALALLSRPISRGFDPVLQRPTAFSTGFMLDPIDENGAKLRRHFGPGRSAFGHPGAGGSLGFADPAGRLGFAFIMNRLEPTVLPGSRTLRLVDALTRDLHALQHS